MLERLRNKVQESLQNPAKDHWKIAVVVGNAHIPSLVQGLSQSPEAPFLKLRVLAAFSCDKSNEQNFYQSFFSSF